MQTNDSSVERAIDPSVLAEVARKSLGRDALKIQDWQAGRLGGGAGNPVSAGLYRVSGFGSDQGERLDWSVVLKIIQSPANVGRHNMGEADDPAHWNYWKREILVFRSGLLDALPVGLVAPRCYAVEERPGDTAWLWLEEIHDDHGGAWDLERYALTARHLGRLNGLYACGRPLPGYAWLSTDLLAQWVAKSRAQPLSWNHPRMWARYPAESPFRTLFNESDRFIDRLNRLPRALCHGDTYPTNFMSRRSAGGPIETVALDWALANIGPLGDDLAQYTYGVSVNLPEVGREELIESLFASYLAGLRDSGCQEDPQRVRFGFAATAALRIGLFQHFLMEEERLRGIEPAQEAQAPAPPMDAFETFMARQACELLEG